MRSNNSFLKLVLLSVLLGCLWRVEPKGISRLSSKRVGLLNWEGSDISGTGFRGQIWWKRGSTFPKWMPHKGNESGNMHLPLQIINCGISFAATVRIPAHLSSLDLCEV